jgi:hypothetical protein
LIGRPILFYFIFVPTLLEIYKKRSSALFVFISSLSTAEMAKAERVKRKREREKKGQTRNNNKHSNQISQQPTTPAPFS